MIQITEKATEEFKRIMREENDGDAHGIRIGIKGGGCSGFSYVMQFEKEAREFDRVFQADDVPIFIDAKSLVYLSGIEIDYETDLLNRGFKFNNPNAVKSCGCGTSFAV
ncbi:MAG: iron-sulfur cluster assembly accessory protein [Acidobacteria bacterium]|nr:iron-sulfur cluster assembly accessory protein [Acidobacteriota bacterium]MCB9396182.1 iron-sulfur cluster assembly accessory protein [Acidobacteriota bacterium]